MAAATREADRIGEVEHRPDGSAHCRLLVPLGHPASRMITVNGNVVEVENARRYSTGPGRTAVTLIDPHTGRGTPVAWDLLPAGPGQSPLRATPEQLADALRRGIRAFDRRVRTPEAPAPEWVQ